MTDPSWGGKSIVGLSLMSSQAKHQQMGKDVYFSSLEKLFAPAEFLRRVFLTFCVGRGVPMEVYPKNISIDQREENSGSRKQWKG